MFIKASTKFTLNVDLLLTEEMGEKSIIVLLFIALSRVDFNLLSHYQMQKKKLFLVQAKVSCLLLFILHFLVVVSMAHGCLQLILMIH